MIRVRTCSFANGTAPSECVPGSIKVKDGGVTTGRCAISTIDGANNCEVYGWCPPEDDSQTVALAGVLNMSVFIKVTATATCQGLQSQSFVHQKSLTWHVDYHQMNTYFDFSSHGGPTVHWDNLNGTKPTEGWNLFTIGQLLEMGGLEPTLSLLMDGAELELDIPFDCDLDLDPDLCQPKPFVLKRIDSVNASLSHGADTRQVILDVPAVPAARKVSMQKTSLARTQQPILTVLVQVVKRYGFKLEVTMSGLGSVRFNWHRRSRSWSWSNLTSHKPLLISLQAPVRHRDGGDDAGCRRGATFGGDTVGGHCADAR